MAEQVYEHKSLGLRLVLPSVGDVRQRDVEKWLAAMRQYRAKEAERSSPALHATLLQSAIAAGLVRQPEELKAADVPDLHPRRVRWYGEKLSEFYNALVEVPADDLSDDGAGESEVSNGND